MSEHIIEIPDYTSPFDPVARTVSLGERIVRCRDCESYRERVNGCVEFGDESRGEYANVEPDGFCYWGKRKESE